MIINHIMCEKKRNIFETECAHDIINRNKIGVTVDVYSGGNSIADIKNDFDHSYDTDYHMEAIEFLKTLDTCSCDTIICDPPTCSSDSKYWRDKLGLPKIVDVIDGKERVVQYTQINYWSILNREISRVMKPGGIVIYSGCTSTGVGKKLGFELKELNILCHGGWTPDTYITVETKTKVEPTKVEPTTVEPTVVEEPKNVAVIDDIEVNPKYEQPPIKDTKELIIDDFSDIDLKSLAVLIVELKKKVDVRIVHGQYGSNDIVNVLSSRLGIECIPLRDGSNSIIETYCGKNKIASFKSNEKPVFEMIN